MHLVFGFGELLSLGLRNQSALLCLLQLCLQVFNHLR